MHLKVFIFPAMVIAVLVMSIGFIRPAVATLNEKKIQLAMKEAELGNLDMIVANVTALNGFLDSRPKTEAFVHQYLPDELDQERAVDTFNFLASRSGLSITDMDFKDVSNVMPVVAPAEEPLDAGAVVSVFSRPVVRKYTATVTVRGSYESIRAFFDRVAHSDRLKEVSLLEIKRDEDQSEEGVGGDTDVDESTQALLGTFSAEFSYFPQRPVVSGVSTPAFQKSMFDTTVADNAASIVSDPIPQLDVSLAGRANPFQR